MEANLNLEELHNTTKGKVMKDTARGPDRIPYSVYNKLQEHARPLIQTFKPYTLVGSGSTITKQVQDPLAETPLENQLYIHIAPENVRNAKSIGIAKK